MRAFEDFAPGQVFDYGGITVERDEMLAFAAAYDPQPMHLSDAGAASGLVPGLIASGWFTGCLMMRMNCEAIFGDSTSMGAPGIEELRWLKPVRAGDRLFVRCTVLDARASSSRPDRGIVSFQMAVANQHGEPVMTVRHVAFFGRRSA